MGKRASTSSHSLLPFAKLRNASGMEDQGPKCFSKLPGLNLPTLLVPLLHLLHQVAAAACGGEAKEGCPPRSFASKGLVPKDLFIKLQDCLHVVLIRGGRFLTSARAGQSLLNLLPERVEISRRNY